MHLTTRTLVFVLAVVLALPVSLAFAGSHDNPPPLAGWTHSPAFSPDDSPQRHGLLLPGADVVRSSPVIAEIDGNTSDGKEVAVGSSDGTLYVYHSNGQLLWQKSVVPPCAGTGGKINSAPAVGQLFGNGIPYVVVSYGTIEQTDCDGGVVAYRGVDGTEAWRYSLKTISPTEPLHGVISSPSLADADGDGRLEIGFGGLDRNVHLLNADGTIRWIYHAADTVWSSPAFVNVDSSPDLELVIGTDISANSRMVPPTPDGGYLYAFKPQPRSPQHIPFNTGYIWRTTFDQAIYSSPSVGDVLPGNPGNEIVIGASCSFPYSVTNSGDKRGKWIKILRPSDGAVIQTLPTSACVQSSPALGDLDDDGVPEIVATINSPTANPDNCHNSSMISAWKATNATPIWTVVPHDPNSGCNDAFGGDLQSPVIADLDGNGSLEVMAANFWSVGIFNGRTGAPLTCQNPSCGSQTSLFAWDTLKSTPAVGDINGDGKLDLAIGGGHIFNNGHGMFYAWTGFTGLLRSPAGGQPAYSAPWPMFRGDALHTGTMAVKRLVASPPALNALLQVGSTAVYPLTFSTNDGSQATWSVTVNDPSNILRLNRTTGTTADVLQVTLTAPAQVGTYTASLTLQATGYPSVTIPVTLHAAQNISYVFLPIVIR